MTRNTLWAILTVAVLGSVGLLSQSCLILRQPVYTLSGLVTDPEAQCPVAGAVVTIEGLTDRTDARGHYQLGGITPGTETLTVLAEGFGDFSMPIQISDADKTFDVCLEYDYIWGGTSLGLDVCRADIPSLKISGATIRAVNLDLPLLPIRQFVTQGDRYLDVVALRRGDHYRVEASHLQYYDTSRTLVTSGLQELLEVGMRALQVEPKVGTTGLSKNPGTFGDTSLFSW
jgi:hypothetical protein